jgi:hypothetical protein
MVFRKPITTKNVLENDLTNANQNVYPDKVVNTPENNLCDSGVLVHKNQDKEKSY